MNSGKYLSGRLREVFTEGKWVVGTNFKDEIVDLDWKSATYKIAHFNTIADLIFHIQYYIVGVINVLEGGELNIKDKFSFEAPEIASSKDWIERVNQFNLDAEKLILLVERMSQEKLLSTFDKEEYGSYMRNLDVMMEHSYYHLGQIILIKKQLKSQH